MIEKYNNASQKARLAHQMRRQGFTVIALFKQRFGDNVEVRSAAADPESLPEVRARDVLCGHATALKPQAVLWAPRPRQQAKLRQQGPEMGFASCHRS
jgi:hypothetical protein